MKEALKQIVRGFCMGAADVVPGVSGGTVALILGIYARLINAISHVDGTFCRLVYRRHWRKAFLYVDAPFLLALITGILTGISVTALTVHELLEANRTRPYTLAVFFGMIAASGMIVQRMIHAASAAERIRQGVFMLSSLVIAAWITSLDPLQSGADSPSLVFLFVCGAIAICAMILPGISGAMILILLGIYPHLTAIPKQLQQGQDVPANLLMLGVFATGCAVGLLSFTKLLRLLLTRHLGATMAVLCGLMFGSLPRLWPFQIDLTPGEPKFEDKRFEPIWPQQFDLEVLLVSTIGVSAAIAVIVLHVVINKHAVVNKQAVNKQAVNKRDV